MLKKVSKLLPREESCGQQEKAAAYRETLLSGKESCCQVKKVATAAH
jgi:hypothetical protein